MANIMDVGTVRIKKLSDEQTGRRKDSKPLLSNSDHFS